MFFLLGVTAKAPLTCTPRPPVRWWPSSGSGRKLVVRWNGKSDRVAHSISGNDSGNN